MRVDTLRWHVALRDAWAFRRGTLWAANLNNVRAKPVTQTRIAAHFARIGDATRSQLIHSASQMDPISPQALKRRFDHGSRCYGVWVDGALVSYGWLTYGPEWVGEFERNLQIPAGDAYIWDCATLPAYRRLGLFRSLLGFMVSDLLHEDVEHLWIISVLDAPAIARGISAAGFKPVANLAYLRMFNVRGLLMRSFSGVSAPQFKAAQQIFTDEGDSTYGPLVLGISSPDKPPDTHF